MEDSAKSEPLPPMEAEQLAVVSPTSKSQRFTIAGPSKMQLSFSPKKNVSSKIQQAISVPQMEKLERPAKFPGFNRDIEVVESPSDAFFRDVISNLPVTESEVPSGEDAKPQKKYSKRTAYIVSFAIAATLLAVFRYSLDVYGI